MFQLVKFNKMLNLSRYKLRYKFIRFYFRDVAIAICILISIAYQCFNIVCTEQMTCKFYTYLYYNFTTDCKMV